MVWITRVHEAAHLGVSLFVAVPQVLHVGIIAVLIVLIGINSEISRLGCHSVSQSSQGIKHGERQSIDGVLERRDWIQLARRRFLGGCVICVVSATIHDNVSFSVWYGTYGKGGTDGLMAKCKRRVVSFVVLVVVLM